MFSETMHLISTFDRPAGYHRLLWHLLSVLDAVQKRKVSMPEMCRETGMGLSTIQRALLQLIADRVIIADGNTVARALRLNNRIAWTSSAEKWNAGEADPEIVNGRAR
jgi:lambda repressor-like predicted transcriptional regulator